jgi:hypothetical protein
MREVTPFIWLLPLALLPLMLLFNTIQEILGIPDYRMEQISLALVLILIFYPFFF